MSQPEGWTNEFAERKHYNKYSLGMQQKFIMDYEQYELDQYRRWKEEQTVER